MKDWLTGFWYAVARQADLTSGKQPLKVTALGQRLALFLNETGQVSAVNDICPHMGASLSLGKVSNGKIVCPYHHFQFNGNGNCDHVPGMDNSRIPCTMALDSYPTQIRYGLIWVFLGHQEGSKRAPIVEIPEFADSSFIQSVASEMTWSGSLRPMFENLIDFSHFSTLHGQSFGNPSHFVTERYPITTGQYEVRAEVKVKLAAGNGIFPEVPELGLDPDYTFQSRFFMPSVVVNTFRLGEYANTTLWTFTPSDESRVVIRSIGVRNYQAGSGTDQSLTELGKRIYEEDRSVVESCLPEVLPHCIPVLVDRYVVACRKLYNQCLKNGDTAAKHAHLTPHGQKLTIIPSPTRRANPSFARAWRKHSKSKPS